MSETNRPAILNRQRCVGGGGPAAGPLERHLRAHRPRSCTSGRLGNVQVTGNGVLWTLAYGILLSGQAAVINTIVVLQKRAIPAVYDLRPTGL
ncbi:hypothetical protein EVAR_60098_1 [Eumeta japonica]|uniref:Uncharacterized protein n=1 Tax=Eumeta variegata TaxID=151549 RepID=A0A4C2A669_EUMVA|nr:hypothetical protein EVAR_60098_1 [Eumeta japonica]